MSRADRTSPLSLVWGWICLGCGRHQTQDEDWVSCPTIHDGGPQMVKESGMIFPQYHPLSSSHQTSQSNLWRWRHCLLIGGIDRKWSKELTFLRIDYLSCLSQKMWALPFSSSGLCTLSEQRESSAAVWAWSSTELLLLSFPGVFLSFWSERGGLSWVLLLPPPLKNREISIYTIFVL